MKINTKYCIVGSAHVFQGIISILYCTSTKLRRLSDAHVSLARKFFTEELSLKDKVYGPLFFINKDNRQYCIIISLTFVKLSLHGIVEEHFILLKGGKVAPTFSKN